MVAMAVEATAEAELGAAFCCLSWSAVCMLLQWCTKALAHRDAICFPRSRRTELLTCLSSALTHSERPARGQNSLSSIA